MEGDKKEGGEITLEASIAMRAECGWRKALKLPDDPPWKFSEDVKKLPETAKQGIFKRPLIHPPPCHIQTTPSCKEIAEQEPGASEIKKRLEDRFKDESGYRDGEVVFDDTSTFVWPPESNSRSRSAQEERVPPPLFFESRFEGGNLRKAVRVGTREYDLILRPDKDSGHVQWYYFMVANVRKNVSYVINIVNFVKNKSLYNQGLKPLLYSTKDADRKKIGWKRAGSRCVYYSRGNRYTLTFTIEFDHDRDVCFLAHCYPYVYTDLQLFLSSLENDVSRKKTVLRKELCRSLAGNQVDLLIISDDPQNWQKNSKQSIFLTARVHPGETQASWAMQGCIEFLTSNSPEALFLRQKYNFFVVPMLNPDGVINGHYRCSLAGQDLNRIWQNPDFTRHPCIWHTKNLMKNLLSKKLIFFCDFHGHSTKKNAFMYGCDPNACFPGKVPVHQWKNPNSPCNFPMIMNEISTAFSFQDCDFRMHKSKLTTGRVVVYREFGITQSYTFEVSFLGHKISDNMVHFNITDLLQLGQHFGLAFMKLLCSCESGNKVEACHELSKSLNFQSYSVQYRSSDACVAAQVDTYESENEKDNDEDKDKDEAADVENKVQDTYIYRGLIKEGKDEASDSEKEQKETDILAENPILSSVDREAESYDSSKGEEETSTVCSKDTSDGTENDREFLNSEGSDAAVTTLSEKDIQEAPESEKTEEEPEQAPYELQESTKKLATLCASIESNSGSMSYNAGSFRTDSPISTEKLNTCPPTKTYNVLNGLSQYHSPDEMANSRERRFLYNKSLWNSHRNSNKILEGPSIRNLIRQKIDDSLLENNPLLEDNFYPHSSTPDSMKYNNQFRGAKKPMTSREEERSSRGHYLPSVGPLRNPSMKESSASPAQEDREKNLFERIIADLPSPVLTRTASKGQDSPIQARLEQSEKFRNMEKLEKTLFPGHSPARNIRGEAAVLRMIRSRNSLLGPLQDGEEGSRFSKSRFLPKYSLQTGMLVRVPSLEGDGLL